MCFFYIHWLTGGLNVQPTGAEVIQVNCEECLCCEHGTCLIYAVGQYVIFLFLYSLTAYKSTGRKNETERISYQMKWDGYCIYYVASISC